ncbi:MAG: adenylate kinase [Flavobacteriia bacterium]|jgi:adenylate kinase|nr:adenylate kinase [Flavobacteriia bacterium]
MINLILFGKPGAGKGTQAAFLKKRYDLVHISTGDLFRHHIQQKTALGTLAQSYMDQGDLVPDQVTINMLEQEVVQNPQAKGFIFDGFPRTTAQAQALDEFLNVQGMAISATLALEAADDLLVDRLLKRGETSGRTDDQDEAKIRNRFDEYNAKTAPLKAYYQAQNKFFIIDGVGAIEEITARLEEVVDQLG